MDTMGSQFRLSKSLEKVLSMKGGNEESSYVNNSSVQNKIVQALKPILEHAIYENMRLEIGLVGGGSGTFRIADLGCGTGINTLLVADTIIRAMKAKQQEMTLLDLEVSFTDLPSNDFNSLLRMLPPYRLSNSDSPLASRSYFARVVSASHFGRLFPRESLHFCHSSMSLHWLSQIPESVEDKSSRAWSGSRVYVSNDCDDAVGAAYLSQFDKDLTAFLRARAEEMISGGCMFLAFIGRNHGTQIMKDQGRIGENARVLEYAFEDLLNEGLVEKEKWDSFNIPMFGPNPEELQSIIEREKSFEIKSIRVLGGFPAHPITEVRQGEEEMFGIRVENFYRALFENIVRSHLGCEKLTNEFFVRIGKRAAAKYDEYVIDTIDLLVVVLSRKEGA